MLGKPLCCFDPAGLIFAAGVESQVIQLYDIRAFNKVCPSVQRLRRSSGTCRESGVMLVTSSWLMSFIVFLGPLCFL